MKTLFILMSLLSPLVCAQTFIKKRLMNAQAGDFALYEKQKNQHLLHIHSIKNNKLVLEEMSFSKKKMPNGVKAWLQHNKDDFSSHNMIEIDLERGNVLECYSFTQKRFIELSKEECFILNLIELNLKNVPDSEKRKIGPAPQEGFDRRKIWSPPHVVEGKKIKTNFQVLSAKWPTDNTPLSGKYIETYFDPTSPFAYWIEIKDTSGLALRVLCKDSGKNLKPLSKEMPRRHPRIIGSLKERQDKLTLKVSCPAYYEDFKVYATNIHSEFSTPYEVGFTIKYNEKQNILNIILNKNELKKILEPNQSYALEFHTYSPIHCRLESIDSFTLND